MIIMSNAPMVPYYYISGNITFIFLTISILIINVLPGSAEQTNLDIGFVSCLKLLCINSILIVGGGTPYTAGPLNSNI